MFKTMCTDEAVRLLGDLKDCSKCDHMRKPSLPYKNIPEFWCIKRSDVHDIKWKQCDHYSYSRNCDQCRHLNRKKWDYRCTKTGKRVLKTEIYRKCCDRIEY